MWNVSLQLLQSLLITCIILFRIFCDACLFLYLGYMRYAGKNIIARSSFHRQIATYLLYVELLYLKFFKCRNCNKLLKTWLHYSIWVLQNTFQKCCYCLLGPVKRFRIPINIYEMKVNAYGVSIFFWLPSK